ncbi:diacylglycerol kinase family protein [Lapidilactobacillus mulanensis]|uniref:Diacylglycerol kinase family protein n=1 Tax=Lapidilactobacillus mulanensis TaxID=2485999 RepID=A0ABW4DQ48_9LACO|nr:diacylglycerol kinase family protein [Lapidilactobacillus mulanensis]
MAMGLNDNSHQTKKNHTFLQSCSHALEGLKWTFQDEANFKRHLSIAVLVLLFGLLFQVSKLDWLWLIVVIFLVLIAELWNTAVEYIVDLLVQKHYDPLAKKIKDVSAAIVLVAALLAVVVGLIVFVPHLGNLFH